MLFQFTRENIEDFAIKSTRRTIVLENFYNALFNFGILYYLLLESCGTNFLNSSVLLNLFTLIIMMDFSIKVLIN